MATFLFQYFKTDISGIPLPKKFTFPFYYEPHPLAVIAAKELQYYLENQTDFEHNFGLNLHQKGLVIGKMFGVLVVQNNQGELGYLLAFSGKLAEQNHLEYFVPTVFDMLAPNSFFVQEQNEINVINLAIEKLEAEENYQQALQTLESIKEEAEKDIARHKNFSKEQKQIRKQKRAEALNSLNSTDFSSLEQELNQESQQEGILLKKMIAYWNYKRVAAENNVAEFTVKLNDYKELRKQKSNALQQRLFAEYAFLNSLGQTKSLGAIFNDNPPAGAGECAAPKLLHYAFQNQLQPICMAEFWWGQSPKSEVRQHQQFYPSCKSKCEPILLGHMLLGLEMDANPLEINPAEGKELEILYEDDVMVVVNKPAEFLSVPGKQITDSVWSRMKQRYPEATGPLIVHRLDMSTSGILVMAKTEEAYLHLQRQFIKRTIRKCYEALLDGIVLEEKGKIELPLRVDLEDRPRQLVCFEYGKNAVTEWEVIQRENGQTRVHFYPITGRTHQLRVHASHQLGLHTPIVGDDLYGTKSDRLHLHAKEIILQHPVSNATMQFVVQAPF